MNLNDIVKVKLTEFAKTMVRRDYNDFWLGCTGTIPNGGMLIEEDEEGFSKWALWELFFNFGKYMSPGKTVFEGPIVLVEVAKDERA